MHTDERLGVQDQAKSKKPRDRSLGGTSLLVAEGDLATLGMLRVLFIAQRDNLRRGGGMGDRMRKESVLTGINLENLPDFFCLVSWRLEWELRPKITPRISNRTRRLRSMKKTLGILLA
jgi:hypothetical protein